VSLTTGAHLYGARFSRVLLVSLANLVVLLGYAHAQATGGVEVQIILAGASNTKCDIVPNVICYWKQAQPRLSKKSMVINSAVNGSTASEFNKHFAERVQPYHDSRYKYNILALQLGGNDILKNTSGDTTFNDLIAVVRKWKALGPRNFAAVATVPYFGYSQLQLPQANKLNRLILSEQSFDATFDIGGIRQLKYGRGCPPKNLSPDCSHLTTTGNKLVASLFSAAINSLLTSSGPGIRENSSGLAK
jgi:lysophospholipase L1-like esterase